LRGFTVGIKAGDASINVLKRHGITTLKEYDSYNDIIVAAKRHDLRLFCIDTPPALYYLYKYNMEHEFHSAFVLYSGQFHRAVRKGDKELLRLVEEGFKAIPDKEHKAINDRWLGEALVSQEHLRTMIIVGLTVAFIILVLFGFNIVLRRKVRGKTAELAATVDDLRKSELRFRAIFNSVSDCIFIHEIEHGSIIDINSRACEVFGYTRDEILHMEVQDLSSGQGEYAQAGALEMIRLTLVLGPQLRIWHAKRKDGTLFWVEVAMHKANLGGQDRILVSCHDITAQRLAMERLKQSEDKFSRLFRLSPDSIILSNATNGRLVDVNEAFTRTTGYERHEVIGKTAMELRLLPEEQALQRLHARLQEDGHLDNLEVEVRYKDGTLAHCSLSTQAVNIGPESYRLTIAHDITEMKKMHEVMVQTEKMLSVGGIAAGIAHEINNPLGIVLQAAQTLAQRLNPLLRKNQEAAKTAGLDLAALDHYAVERKLFIFLDDIRDAAMRASSIIRNMLDFSRRSESHRVQCSLGDIIDKAIVLAGSDYDLKKSYDFKKIKIIREGEATLPQVRCTETEIEQVVLNLLRNAAQAMCGAKQPIDHQPTITIRTTHNESRVRIEIEDNGPGMSAEVRRRVFEPFYTTKAPGVGTGLGLSVSYFIVTKGHGGVLSVDSRPGKGACFIIELPNADIGSQKENTDG